MIHDVHAEGSNVSRASNPVRIIELYFHLKRHVWGVGGGPTGKACSTYTAESWVALLGNPRSGSKCWSLVFLYSACLDVRRLNHLRS